MCLTQLILESEMDKARNEQGIMGSEFHKPPGAGGSRPSSSMSNRSGQPNDVREIYRLHANSFIHKISLGQRLL